MLRLSPECTEINLKGKNTIIGEIGEVLARYYLRKKGFYPILKPRWVVGHGPMLLSASTTLNAHSWECKDRLTEEQRKYLLDPQDVDAWDFVAFGPGIWGKEIYIVQVKTSCVGKTAKQAELPPASSVCTAKNMGLKPFLLNVFWSSQWEVDFQWAEL